jgi:predicted DNA-binding protein
MLHGDRAVLKGKQTSFRFSATTVHELDWLVLKLGQTQTTVVEAAIHRLAEAEGYQQDPRATIRTILSHEAGHAMLAEALLEQGILIVSAIASEIGPVEATENTKAEIAREIGRTRTKAHEVELG